MAGTIREFRPLQSNYDSIECRADWAHRRSLNTRTTAPGLYSREATGACRNLRSTYGTPLRADGHAGWMHNYMRMYWAKKILEWSPSPAEAYQTAVYLNDKY